MRQWVIGAFLGFALVVGLVAVLGKEEAVERPAEAMPSPSVPKLQVRQSPQKLMVPPSALKHLPLGLPTPSTDAGEKL